MAARSEEVAQLALIVGEERMLCKNERVKMSEGKRKVRVQALFFFLEQLINDEYVQNRIYFHTITQLTMIPA